MFLRYIDLYKQMTPPPPPPGMAGLNPMGLIGRIYVGDH